MDELREKAFLEALNHASFRCDWLLPFLSLFSFIEFFYFLVESIPGFFLKLVGLSL